jgi:hypothetical protein
MYCHFILSYFLIVFLFFYFLFLFYFCKLNARNSFLTFSVGQSITISQRPKPFRCHLEFRVEEGDRQTDFHSFISSSSFSSSLSLPCSFSGNFTTTVMTPNFRYTIFFFASSCVYRKITNTTSKFVQKKSFFPFCLL